MRKVFMVVIGIFICIAVYWGGKILIDYSKNVYTVMTYSSNESSSSGNFAFKVTPENLELVNSYLKVNNSFLDTMSKEITLDKEIKNVDKLLNKSPNYKYYYSTKLKLEKAVFNGLPFLMDNLSSGTSESFLKDNSAYLGEVFGITELKQLENVASNLSGLVNKEIKFAEVMENSVIYNPYGQSTVFRVKVGYDDTDFVYFSVNAFHGYDTETQSAPVIVFNALGGMS